MTMIGMETAQYQFSEDWFSGHIPRWTEMLATDAKARKILEVGSFEGRSTVWLIENALAETGELYCVDTWQGSPEHSSVIMEDVHARFLANIEIALRAKPDVKVIQIRGLSEHILPRLIAEGHVGTFDFVYVDGCHEAVNVLTDLCFAFLLCRHGGLICVDDYLWPQHVHPLRKPKISVDAFTNIFCEHLTIVSQGYQVFLRKH
jgi:predicted O-methyltransferase YrrM